MNKKLNFIAILSTFLLFAFTMQLSAKTWYVSPAGSDSNNGESWSSPLATATKAIALAENGDEIWFAGGLYEIGSGGINYNVAKSLKFYASFAGTETEVSQRAKVADGEEWEFVNPTVFKMTAGSTAIWVNNASITATFDGFTLDGDNIAGTRGIAANNAVEVTISRSIVKNNNMAGGFGAGILGTKKITVEHCLVVDNSATKPSSGSKWGGGIAILAANSSIKNSTIKNNTYDDSGGGIGVDNVGGVVIADCKVIGNSTTSSGGGICGYRMDEIRNCWVEGNSAAGGGGLFLRAYSGSGVVYNTIVVNNTASGNGGGITFGNATNAVKVYNSIIANNKSGGAGVIFSNNTANHQMINCLLYNNTNGGEVSNVQPAGTNNVFKNNIIDSNSIANLTQTASVIETDPTKLFTDIDNGDYTPPTEGFAGLNKGDATGLTFDEGKDFAGNVRVQEGVVEIGAYELTPASLVTLKSLKINGVTIDGFMPGLTEYNIALPTSVSSYPAIEIEPTLATATVSPLTFSPVVFDVEGVNTVSFTVTNGAYSTTYTINIRIDKMPELTHQIMMRIRESVLTKGKVALEAEVDEYLSRMQIDGSFNDCSYANSNFDALIHLDRLGDMGHAYTQAGNKYYESDDLYAKIVKGYEYWYSKSWNSSSWWYNWISHPKRLGIALISVYGGKKDIRQEKVFENLIENWRVNLGDPDYPGPQAAGANKSDIAMHWIYRSCLSNNEADLEKGVDRAFVVIDYTTGEGIQHDLSFRQHGAQLYIGGYGTELLSAVTTLAYYFIDTDYELSGERLDILSQFVRNTYLPTIRGKRMSFSVLGRGMRRVAQNASSFTSSLQRLISIDSAHAEVYQNAIKRLQEEEAADFGVPTTHTHFYRGEYTLHQRPEYTFDVRMVSNRMVRSEYDINENQKAFFLSDGATGIFVDGEEYGEVLNSWDWRKIPGTTIPDLAVLRRADSYIFSGRSSYAGGVSDGRYGVTAFDMINDQELFAWDNDGSYSGTPNNSGTRMPALDFGAKKSWFIFDKEIVCLGAGIYSGHEEPIFTTVNQSARKGETIIESNGVESALGAGTHAFEQVRWALNDKVAYYFPEQPNIQASVSDTDVFALWFNHGVRPTDATYEYIIVPNTRTAAEAKAYNPGNVEILANTDSVQVVYHKELKLYGLAFFKACGFQNENLLVEASEACVVMIKDANKVEMSVWIADPQKQAQPIKLGIKTPYLDEAKEIIYQNPASPHQGKSLEFTVNDDSPAYAGKDVLLDRSDWIITASSVGPTDATVAVDGDVPGYMIDGDTQSAFLFVKPGKNYGGVTVPAGVKPSFTIDMKQAREITYLVYRHRDIGNTSAWLRASKGSFYGKNVDADEFQVVIENFDIATDVTEVRVDFPEKVSYRYVKFVMEAWDSANGSTIQLSEFNLGNTVVVDISSNVDSPILNTENGAIKLYPNPIKAGTSFYIETDSKVGDTVIEVYALPGNKITEKKVITNRTELVLNHAGTYIVSVKNNIGKQTTKIVVN